MIDLTDRKNCFYWQTDRKLTVEDYARIFLKRHEVSLEDIIKTLKAGIKSISNIKSIEVITPDKNVIRGNVNIVRKVIINRKSYIVRLHPKGVKNGYFYVEKVAQDLAIEHRLPVPKILEVHEAKN